MLLGYGVDSAAVCTGLPFLIFNTRRRSREEENEQRTLSYAVFSQQQRRRQKCGTCGVLVSAENVGHKVLMTPQTASSFRLRTGGILTKL